MTNHHPDYNFKNMSDKKNIEMAHMILNVTTPTEKVNFWTWASIDIILILIIISGNILTICALKISRKLSAIVSNHFICSLACSDLLVGLMLPYHLAFYIAEPLGKNKLTCLLRFVMIVFACCASIYHILAIAADRFIAIVHPLHYNRYMTKRVANIIIGFGWVTAVTIATMPIYWNNWKPADDCELYFVLSKNYVTFVLTPSFGSIWIAMLIVYWRIWREARGHAKRLRNAAHNTPGGPINDRKSIQVVFLILGCFTLCWLPYFVVVISIRILDLSANTAYESAFTLAMVNSGINPAIYAWKNKGFRKAFIRLLQCSTPNYNDSQHHFISGRKEKTPSNATVKGVSLCVVNEQCIVESEIELKEKCKTVSNVANNNGKICQDIVKKGCEPKDVIVNGITKIKTELKSKLYEK